MEYISSDTNVWLDFVTIDRLEFPFRLPYVYLMNNDAVADELLNPPDLGQRLVALGLQETELSEEEFFLAEEYMRTYRKLSMYDSVALAIAKVRGIILLTGDGPLRKAAAIENVSIMGTIGVLDQLYKRHLVKTNEYTYCLRELKKYNGGRVRLPETELEKRIDAVAVGWEEWIRKVS